MANFDWISFCKSRGIEYDSSGPHVSKDHITIQCPFCGSGFWKKLMSIDLTGKGWRCWRRPLDHKGRDPTALVQKLLGCSFDLARQITGSRTSIPDDFMAQVQNQLQPSIPLPKTKLILPWEFRTLSLVAPSCRPYIQYMQGRGFTDRHITSKFFQDNIRYSTRGPYKGRIIFPIDFNKELVTWTGRTIYKASHLLRYKTLSDDPEKADREGSPTHPSAPLVRFPIIYVGMIIS